MNLIAKYDLKQEYQEIIKYCSCDLISENDKQIWLDSAVSYFYPGISQTELINALILTANSLIEHNYRFNKVSCRVLLYKLKQEIFADSNIDLINIKDIDYKNNFIDFIEKGIDANLLNPDLNRFDLEKLSNALIVENDNNFNYLGLKTIYDRYLLKIKDKLIEMPQYFFMRVAMGLALNEKELDTEAIKFYKLMSNFDFLPSTPTLFNSATLRPQLSSCFITTIKDDLEAIYDGIKENALLSKYSGGLGNDWSNIRGLGSYIKGTNGLSQGLIPFLKVANDTALAVNQGGKRNGATCAYLETWHIDIEDFLELRKNTGDDRRRTHDMNTANWVCDLFMERVIEDGDWTLFSPDDVPLLHDSYGEKFRIAYDKYEHQAKNGQIKLFKTIKAKDLWKKMLTALYETGHPWITFKDPCNLRSPQKHMGVVHSSNLCTEITLNTSDDETAVCNLGSINLSNHLINDNLDLVKLEKTINTAMQMLDNVIDINYYASTKAYNANSRHRPVGLGLMGFMDALYKLKIPITSAQACEFADKSMETISYFAILASSKLAKNRGKYSSFENSLWDQGILPIDSLDLLEKERSKYVDLDKSTSLDWQVVRDHIKRFGMRNSNCLAIAPTATIANIAGVTSSIEPTFENIFVKSNLSGEFTVINEYLASDLESLNMWNIDTIDKLKAESGSVQNFDNLPIYLKDLYKTAFEIDPLVLINLTARRQKWIDQSVSLNLYVANPSGKAISNMYIQAWLKGLKTTYYLRTKSATNIEKSTITINKLNMVAKTSCNINDLDCEACQ